MNDRSLTFWDHIEELRQTIIKGMVVIFSGMLLSLVFYPQVFELLTTPYRSLHGLPSELIILGPTDGLTTVMKMSFWVGLAGTSPLWLYFVLQFIAPALHSRERSILIPFFILTLLFFSIGLMFAFNITIPLANQSLEAINQSLGTSLWTLSHYLNYTVVLLLANALAFESCVILFFLVHFGWISAETMKNNRRAAIVVVFIVSALLTPPDILSQLLIAIPLILAYEGAIFYAKFRKNVVYLQKNPESN